MEIRWIMFYIWGFFNEKGKYTDAYGRDRRVL
jgi:hypothetical protein